MVPILNLMPDTIHVGGSKYDMVLTDREWRTREGADGLVDFDTLTVYINADAKPSEILNTLLHELSHVIWREWNLPKRPREERCVTAFGYGWTALFTQNPTLSEIINGLSITYGVPGRGSYDGSSSATVDLVSTPEGGRSFPNWDLCEGEPDSEGPGQGQQEQIDDPA